MVASGGDDLRAALERFDVASAQQRRALEDLVKTLRSRLGVGAVRVSRRGIWGFGRFESARFVVGPHSYRVSLTGGRLRAEVGDAVGAVGLTPAEVPWNEWVERVVRDIDGAIGGNP